MSLLLQPDAPSEDSVPELRLGTRERILSASYDLFARRGIRDVAIDEIIVASDVAKATLYRHFASKDELVLAFLQRREEIWTFGAVEAGARSRAVDPEGQLLAIFDVFDEWFRRDDFEACSFIGTLLEMGADHPAGIASRAHLGTIHSIVEGLAAEAGIPTPDEFARSFGILMKGSIVQACEGDLDAAKRAQSMARLLVAQFRS
ncbi:TetR/AcrR family transcriptional regulator [Glaciihabitans arcticus]|uniref:TetR/AcrR family transcriptional regulator n=1 Tax=Glaciihabitans arcticus TaxID=2668039 RepID=A0A4Q9GT46_9MICO|nr:TetR/AcrR family transcriptional regulator [Glaciihabitans arcticus]TBN57324.1 TetR/AcrR family transcriptional regulator [Glaciihabitans arcticus]